MFFTTTWPVLRHEISDFMSQTTKAMLTLAATPCKTLAVTWMASFSLVLIASLANSFSTVCRAICSVSFTTSCTPNFAASSNPVFIRALPKLSRTSGANLTPIWGAILTTAWGNWWASIIIPPTSAEQEGNSINRVPSKMPIPLIRSRLFFRLWPIFSNLAQNWLMTIHDALSFRCNRFSMKSTDSW